MIGNCVSRGRLVLLCVLCGLLSDVFLLLPGVAHAMTGSLTLPESLGGDELKAVLGSSLTFGAQMRTQSQNVNLIPKSALNPNVCPQYSGSCLANYRTQSWNSSFLVNAPGAASIDVLGGNLNYNKGDLTQAPIKATEDLTLTWRNFGIFARALYFYDLVNSDFTEYHPNMITAENLDSVGRVGTIVPIPALNQFLQAAYGAGVPTRNLTAITGRFYGPGGPVYTKRSNPEVIRQIGHAAQYLDSYLYGSVPVWAGRELSFKLGRQKVNWGESGTIAFNGINSANPLNINNVFRTGSSPEEYSIPVNMIDASFSPLEGVSAEAYYQLEWQPTQIPAPGSYFSTLNVGTPNIGGSINAGAGQLAYDPDCLNHRLENPLATFTQSCATIPRLPDLEPRTSGQYGLKLSYYADWINDGTDLSLSYQHYHSRLPYVSLYSAYPSCGRRLGNQYGLDVTSIPTLLQACPGLPLLTFAGQQATSDGIPINSIRFQLEYPEDIDVVGLSFNTTVGDYSLQGEVAYRPNNPMQVDVHDLGFAAFGPVGSACGLHGVACTENIPVGLGYGPEGELVNYGANDNPVDKAGNVIDPTDAFNVGISAVTGNQRLFPNFVIPYRGGTIAENTPCYPVPGSAEDRQYSFDKFSHPYYPYNTSSPCYIRGYERLHDFEFNIAATRVLGATENWIGADQIVLVYELGAEYVPGLPAYDQLVLQGPGLINWGPTAGADGSGADGSRMACSATPCSYGPDGVRFNIHQQDHTAYPDKLSWGYHILGALKYEQVLPGINVSPTVLLFHDVQGSSPQPVGNFMAGRKTAITNVEIRYHQALSLNLGYAWFWGGGVANNLSDRDFAQAFVRYQF